MLCVIHSLKPTHILYNVSVNLQQNHCAKRTCINPHVISVSVCAPLAMCWVMLAYCCCYVLNHFPKENICHFVVSVRCDWHCSVFNTWCNNMSKWWASWNLITNLNSHQLLYKGPNFTGEIKRKESSYWILSQIFELQLKIVITVPSWITCWETN